MFLAQILRERRRLEQERTTLMRRIGRIDHRLDEIGSTETKIVPTIKVVSDAPAVTEPNAPRVSEPNAPPKAMAAAAARGSGMERHVLPTGVNEVTLQY
jgi:hypothetical protein